MFYTMRGRVITSHRMAFTLDIWNPSMGAEVFNVERAQELSAITANPIREFTPRKAMDIFPAGPRDEILAVLNSTRAASSSTAVETIYTDFALHDLPPLEDDPDTMDI